MTEIRIDESQERDPDSKLLEPSMQAPFQIPRGNLSSSAGNRLLMDRVLRKLDDARNKLVDRNLRNRLINTPLESSRTKSMRVWGSDSEQIFTSLLSQKKQMTFLPISDEVGNEDGRDIQAEFISADTESGSEKFLPTRLTKTNLEKKLKSLFYESKEYEEEQGVNVLYIALGFLKWYEDANSDIPKYAPLVLLPVELSREGAKDRYKLKLRDEDIFTNVSLKLWLREQHSVTLPEIPEDEEWSPQSYFKDVQSAIAKSPRWEVLSNEVLLGFFSFSKFLLWKDLDLATWPSGKSPLEHPIIQKLLCSNGERVEAERALIPDGDLIDDHFTPHDLAYIMDADSSQTEAIQTATSGKDLVIQGPPGTGKSQTITNIIAAAIRDGKKVLFIAEKMAALNVVHQRLVKSKLGPVCLELHSRKANKASVLGQIREAMEMANQPTYSTEPLDTLKSLQDTLNSHAKRVNRPLEPWGFTPYEILGGISLLYSKGNSLPEFEIPNASNYTKSRLLLFVSNLAELCGRLSRSGVPAKNPWRISKGVTLTPLGLDRLENTCKEGLGASTSLKTSIEDVALELQVDANNWLRQAPKKTAKKLNELVMLACSAPELPSKPLFEFALVEHLSDLKELAATLNTYHASCNALNSKLIEGWKSYNLTTLRVKFAGSGGSIFSIFNSDYRQSLNELKGLCKQKPPSKFIERLSLIDEAIAASSALSSIKATNGKLKELLATLWQEENSNATQIR